MQERNSHYSKQRGHKLRGLAENFRAITGVKPATLQAEFVVDRQTAWLQRRDIKRVPRDGKS